MSLVLTGCVTSKRYRMANEGTPVAVPLNLTTVVAASELRLVTVIVYQGPGSWKLRARWDEYAVGLTNRDAAPLTIDSVALVDMLGVEQGPGTDPWKLEKQSEANGEKYARVGRVVLGVGAAAGAMEVAAIGYGLTGGAVAGVFFLMPAVLIGEGAAVVVMNHNNKLKVEREFSRRRINLPLTIAPGQSVAGSFFFPMTPGPKRLYARGRQGEQPVEIVLELSSLAGLHLKPADPPKN